MRVADPEYRRLHHIIPYARVEDLLVGLRLAFLLEPQTILYEQCGDRGVTKKLVVQDDDDL